MQQLGCKPNSVTFKILLKAYTDYKNPIDAERIRLDMRKAGITLDT
jgi:pentatricopeptide repeat protein